MRYSRMTVLALGAAVGVACGVLGAGACAAPAPDKDPAAALGLPANVAATMQGIDPQRIRAHVRFLSDDLLEGRGTGTRGGDIAAKYIATQFALDGLKPAGDDGGYLQKIDFTGVHTLPATAFTLQPEHGKALVLKLGEDFVTNNQTQTDSADVDAPIVFVGYGIEAPEYRWNDFKGVDVAGKVVLVIVNEPPSKDPKFFNGEALTYYGRWTYKFEEAARKGAVGALIIHRTDLASYGWGVVRSSWSAEQVYLSNDKEPKLKAASWIQLEVARQLFDALGIESGRHDRERRHARFQSAGIAGAAQGACREHGAQIRVLERAGHVARHARRRPHPGRRVFGALRSPRYRPLDERRQHLQWSG